MKGRESQGRLLHVVAILPVAVFAGLTLGAPLLARAQVLARAQSAATPPEPAGESIPFGSERWLIEAAEHRLEEHLGRPSLFMKGGHAWIEDASFLNGSLEFHIAFTGERGFCGGIWRIQDDDSYEEFYLRPHQSGNPDANQYTPIFNGLAGWQLYHGEGYGMPVTYPFNEWIHVRIAFAGDRGEVYIGDMDRPAVVIHELLREPKAGRVGIMAGNFAPAWFSGFRYQEEGAPPLAGEFKDLPAAAAGTVMAWEVSGPFPEAEIAERGRLSPEQLELEAWTRLAADRSGITNLARANGLSREKNTVFTRATIAADGEQVKRLQLGYSDRIRVFLNGSLLYSGNNTYRSRDYRYLGTIGLFDEVMLPLRDGGNELWLAVSESFGGWGVLARLPDQGGVRVVEAQGKR